MIKVSYEFDSKRLEQLLKLAGDYERETFELAQDTFEELQPRHLDDMRRTPKVRRWPADYPGGQLPFDTLKQQRWYWANIGKPHQRTGAMVRGLTQTVERQPHSLSIIARFGVSSTRFVLGDIHTGKGQQLFHGRTGWEPAAPKLTRQGELYYERFVRRYESFVAFYNRG